MDNIVNDKHDTITYEYYSYQREIFNVELLYEAFQKSKQGSDWKPQVQKFEMNLLTELSKLSKELKNKTFKFSPPNEFILNERGKTRVISGDCIRDRVVKRALCDEILIPSIRKYLIYDNGASLKGKGTDFTRNRLDNHLHKFYMETGSNEGGILLGDCTKYFDNIQHELLMAMFKKIIHNDTAIWLLEEVLKQAQIDVSYMSNLEYNDCLNVVFNSLDYDTVDKSLLTGEKYMAKHMNIGDQVEQVAGIFYPHRFDNYIKIVKGIKYYGRYMDDFYIIHEDIGFLKELSEELELVARENGIFINKNKTKAVKLSSYWRFLKVQYSLTDTGKIIKKIHPKSVTRMRRKLKKLVNIMDKTEFSNYYKSWMTNYYKIMSKRQRENMDNLFNKLEEEYYV